MCNCSELRRGNIVNVNLGEGVGSEQMNVRPCVVISNNVGNRFSPVIVVAPLTSKMTKRPMPTHVFLTKEMYGLHMDSIVLCEQVRTIDKRRVINSMGLSLNQLDMIKLNKCLAISIGLVETNQDKKVACSM